MKKIKNFFFVWRKIISQYVERNTLLGMEKMFNINL